MGSPGWIYFRLMEGKGYCFGKTTSPDRRDSEYRKENPFLVKIYDFLVQDIDAVEAELIRLTQHLRLKQNSKEWIRLGEESKAIVDGVRRRYACITYSEWLECVRQEEAVKKQEAERRSAQERRTVERGSQSVSYDPPPKPCPRCRTVTNWIPLAGYRCPRCRHPFR